MRQASRNSSSRSRMRTIAALMPLSMAWTRLSRSIFSCCALRSVISRAIVTITGRLSMVSARRYSSVHPSLPSCRTKRLSVRVPRSPAAMTASCSRRNSSCVLPSTSNGGFCSSCSRVKPNLRQAVSLTKRKRIVSGSARKIASTVASIAARKRSSSCSARLRREISLTTETNCCGLPSTLRSSEVVTFAHRYEPSLRSSRISRS